MISGLFERTTSLDTLFLSPICGIFDITKAYSPVTSLSGSSMPTILSCKPKSIRSSVDERLFVIMRSGAFSNT